MNDFAEKLPIDEVLNELLKTMSEKNHAVLQAPPGAGKTTRIPLALLNSGLFEKKIIKHIDSNLLSELIYLDFFQRILNQLLLSLQSVLLQ